eukprot:scaffold63_cov306-Pinguiococcus_pyrenoidosus.AAC.31
MALDRFSSHWAGRVQLPIGTLAQQVLGEPLDLDNLLAFPAAHEHRTVPPVVQIKPMLVELGVRQPTELTGVIPKLRTGPFAAGACFRPLVRCAFLRSRTLTSRRGSSLSLSEGLGVLVLLNRTKLLDKPLDGGSPREFVDLYRQLHCRVAHFPVRVRQGLQGHGVLHDVLWIPVMRGEAEPVASDKIAKELHLGYDVSAVVPQLLNRAAHLQRRPQNQRCPGCPGLAGA